MRGSGLKPIHGSGLKVIDTGNLQQVQSVTFSSYGAWPNDRESRVVLSDPTFLAASASTLMCAAGATLTP